MTKKKLFFIGGLSLLLLGGVIGGIYLSQRGKQAQAPAAKTEETEKEQQLLMWDDPAGFTFQYPEGLTVDKHDEDQENYAHVELTNKNHPGNIIVWAKDTTALDVGAWVKTEKRFKDANILDTTLGKQPAKKILITTPSSQLIVGMIYEELLFTVEASLEDKEYWTKVHEGIADSFVFKPVESESAQSNDSTNFGGEEEAVDEEEVVQ